MYLCLMYGSQNKRRVIFPPKQQVFAREKKAAGTQYLSI